MASMRETPVRSRQIWSNFAVAGFAAFVVLAIAVVGVWLPLRTGPATGSSPSASGTNSAIGPTASASATPSNSSVSIQPSASASATPPAPSVSAPPASVTASSFVGVTLPDNHRTPRAGYDRIQPRVDAATWFNGQFVLVGRDSGAHTGAWLGDGRNWQRVEIPSLDESLISHLERVGNRLVAIGQDDKWDQYCQGGEGATCQGVNPVAIAYTMDGRSWTRLTGDAVKTFGRLTVNAAAAGPGGLVIEGAQCPVSLKETCKLLVWRTTDGVTWSAGAPFAGDVLDMVGTGDGYFAVSPSYPEGTNAWFSADGVSWKRFSLPPSPAGAASLEATSAGAVAVIYADRCPAFYALTAGSNPSGTPITPHGMPTSFCGTRPANVGGGTVAAIASDGTRIVATGGRTVWASNDGSNWTALGTVDVDLSNVLSPAMTVGQGGVIAAFNAQGPSMEIAFNPTPER